MVEIKTYPIRKWEVSIMILETQEGKKYKVTRRLPELLNAETRVFDNLEEAKKLFNEWLN